VAEAFDPRRPTSTPATKRMQFGGLKVGAAPKKNRGETVTVSLRLNMGDEKSLFGQRAAAQIAGRCSRAAPRALRAHSYRTSWSA